MDSNNSNGTSDVPRILPFESEYIISIIIAVLIIIFNGGVLIMMWKYKSLHNAQNGLLASLAVSDLSSGLLGIPLLFACSFSPPRFCALCSVSFLFFKFISISTVLHILAIIGERCFLVVDPFLHRRLRATSGRTNSIIIGCIWLTSLVASNVPWFWVVGTLDCFPLDGGHEETWNPDTIYELACFVLFFVIPLGLISFCLTKIFIAVHQFTRRRNQRCSQTKDLKEQVRLFKSEMRIFIVLLIVFLLFVVCWLPYFASSLVHFINAEPVWLFEATPYFRNMTSLLNPLVYAFYKDDFYQAVKRRLRSLKCGSKARGSSVFTASNQPVQVPLVALS